MLQFLGFKEPEPEEIPCSPGDFRILSKEQEDEDAFDLVEARDLTKPTPLIGAVAHLVKGALGAGILSAHVAYMKAGLAVAIPCNIVFGIYITYCFHTLLKNAQILYRRTKFPAMSYPDLGEAAFSCHPNPKVQKCRNAFRYSIDIIVCMELFGACATYQIIIARTIKQLVENTQETPLEGKDGYPHIRVYLAAIILPVVLICMIRHLKVLAPFSIVANFIVLICIITSVYYAVTLNPKLENLKLYTDYYSYLEYVGMQIFSMSCAGVVIPVENNLKDPKHFDMVLVIGMTIIILFVFTIAFSGYVAYQDHCESPITVNFPMTIGPKILKGTTAVMIYITHSLNFWVPFRLCFYYIQKRVNPETLVRWEYFWRGVFVIVIGVTAIIFPRINQVMGFLGAFCLSHMAFIWPFIIELTVVRLRPGWGKCNWRLWKGIFFIMVGLVILFLSSTIALISLFKPFFTKEKE